MTTYILEINSEQLAHIRRALTLAPTAKDELSAALEHMLNPDSGDKFAQLEPAPFVNGLCF